MEDMRADEGLPEEEKRPEEEENETQAEKASDTISEGEHPEEDVKETESPEEALAAVSENETTAAETSEEASTAEAEDETTAAETPEEAPAAEASAAEISEEAQTAETESKDEASVAETSEEASTAEAEDEKSAAESPVEVPTAKSEDETTVAETSEEASAAEAEDEKSTVEAQEKSEETKGETGQTQENAEETPEEEPKEKRHYGKFVIAAAAALVVIAGAGYVGYAQQYNTKFFPNTTINHIDVSNLDINEVKDRLAEGVADYTLTLVTRTGDETISGQDIGLSMVYDDSMENWLKEQNVYAWGLHLFQDTPYTVETMVSYDPDMLDAAVADLDCMDPSAMVAPVDAAISDYDDALGGYSVIPEVPGTIINKKNLITALDGALTSMSPELVLADTDVYVPAAVTSDNADLLARLDEYNQYAGMTVIYDFGSEQEVLDGSTIHQWLSAADDGTITVDRDAVSEYVKYLAEKYDTTSQARTLKTTYGPTVTLTKGNYGWKISQSKETDALADIILTGEGQEREPEYQQTAVTRGEKDYGDTYVEINLTAQHLYYYKNGSLVIETDLVSGNESNGNATPDGAYYLAYKQRNAVLRGPRRADGSYEYESPVSYWMPFNGGIGLHDATWRGSFGGSIYKTNGSHGCINLPFSAAKTIYENIDAGTPVFCYRLGSTEPTRTATSGSSGSGSSSRSSSSSTSAAAVPAETVPAIQPIEETAPITEAVDVPAETSAPSGSSNVIVAGQSKSNAGPGAAQQETQASAVIMAGSSDTSEQAAAAPAEAQAAVPAEAQAVVPAETQAAAPAEAQAAVPVETQAAVPVETQAAAPAPVEAAPAAADISMEAPGV